MDLYNGYRTLPHHWANLAARYIRHPTWFLCLKFRIYVPEPNEAHVRHFVRLLNKNGPKSRREYSRFKFIFFPEHHFNGIVHWHGIIDDKYFDKEQATAAWQAVSEGGSLYAEPYHRGWRGFEYIAKYAYQNTSPIFYFGPTHKTA